jgi:hypothetical protein
MIDELLKGIITFIGIIYGVMLVFVSLSLKDFLYLSITAFLMVVTILILGHFMYNVW